MSTGKQKQYAPIGPQDFVTKMNELGYNISDGDGLHEGLMGAILAVAKELERVEEDRKWIELLGYVPKD